jgi:heme oxygenase (mycobilin-producing)
MNSDPAVLINAFEVPEGDDEAFLDAWERARAFLSTQPGYLSTCLHRSVSPGAEFRFVNVALWQSPQAFQAATSQPEFRNAPVPFPFHVSLYEVVRKDKR